MTSDEALLDRWRDGDATAGEELFGRHFRALYRFFRNKLPDGYDDLVQRTFLACVEGRFRIENASFRTYMFGVARNLLYREYRDRNRDGERLDFGVTSVVDLEASPTKALAARSEHKLLAEALQRIPIDFQVCLELYYYEGARGPELAAMLDIPEATVRSRLRRGLEHLRKHIAALAPNQALAQSTAGDLDAWATELRNLLANPSLSTPGT